LREPAPEQQTQSRAGPTDAALVVAARAGEAWAQEALFRRYAPMVNGLAFRLMPGHPDRDDLVQDCFIQALDRLDSLQNPQAFAAWLSSIVVRTAHKRLRRSRLLTKLGLRRTTPIELDQLASRTAPPDVVSELRAIYAAVERLPAQERIALVLRRVEGLSIPEIAEIMNISEATVKRRLGTAEASLPALQNHGGNS
jgi:RNA polymerase sigma-70 factor, ECF subfamily